jgi:hypothetical protein
MNPTRAAAARTRLEAVEAVLSELLDERDALALDALEAKPGADKALANHRAKIETAERVVSEMAGAVKLAERLDLEADAVGVATLRAEQLAAFERFGAERVKAMTEIIQCVAKSTKAFDRYVIATRAMVDAVPTGTRLPVMGFGGDGNSGNWLGDGEILIGREAYRLAELAGAPKLSFAKPPPLSHGTSAKKMQPAAEILEETQAAALRELTGQVARLNRADLEAAGVAVPPLEIVEMPPESPPVRRAPSAKPVAAVLTAPAQPPFDAFAMTDAEALAGITISDCAKACGEHGCALTGGVRCAHPMKGGLQRPEQGRREILARYTAACKAVGTTNIHEVAQS